MHAEDIESQTNFFELYYLLPCLNQNENTLKGQM